MFYDIVISHFYQWPQTIYQNTKTQKQIYLRRNFFIENEDNAKVQVYMCIVTKKSLQ